MKRIVLTNNKKVQSQYAEKADIRLMESASTHEIYEEGRKVVENGGKLIVDPSAGNTKSFYKSLVFIEGEDAAGVPSQRSLELLDKCLKRTAGAKKSKEPVLAGIMQNKDVDSLKRILA